MPNKVCPCCGRKIIAKKSSAPKLDRRLEQDLGRANAAIAALATAESKLVFRSFNESAPSPEALASFRAAVASERKRLSLALSDHRLLWAIYRRTDKSTPYYESAAPLPQPAEPVNVATPEPELVAA